MKLKSNTVLYWARNNSCRWLGEICPRCGSPILPHLACNTVASKYHFRAQHVVKRKDRYPKALQTSYVNGPTQFFFGGCRGNANNFLAESDCIAKCVRSDALPRALAGFNEDIRDPCDQEKVVGLCR